MYFDDFAGRLQKGDAPLLILLLGDSEAVLTEAVRRIREQFKKKHPGGSSRNFEGSPAALGEVLSEARSGSLFGGERLLILQKAGAALGGRSEEPLDHLKEYFQDPNPSVQLVFLAPGMKKTSKAASLAERLGWAVQCSDLPDWKIPEWIRKSSREKGLELDDAAAQRLLERLGGELSFLPGALDQLALAIHPRKRATASEVQDLPLPGAESEAFGILDAVGNRDARKALFLLKGLREGVDAGILALLYLRIRELLSVAAARKEGIAMAEAASTLGMHPFKLKLLWGQSEAYEFGELREALKGLIRLQAGLVGGKLGLGALAAAVERWILKWGRKQGSGVGYQGSVRR